MKYTKEERLDIGRQIYDGEITRHQAAELFDIMYRDHNHLPPKRGLRTTKPYVSVRKILLESNNLEAYEAMSKEELIQELIKARIAEARLKKGYEVKGDGSITQYSKKNIR